MPLVLGRPATHPDGPRARIRSCRLPACSPSHRLYRSRTVAVPRRIGLDVHREFAQIAVWEDGLVRQAGRRVDVVSARVAAFVVAALAAVKRRHRPSAGAATQDPLAQRAALPSAVQASDVADGRVEWMGPTLYAGGLPTRIGARRGRPSRRNNAEPRISCNARVSSVATDWWTAERSAGPVAWGEDLGLPPFVRGQRFLIGFPGYISAPHGDGA